MRKKLRSIEIRKKTCKGNALLLVLISISVVGVGLLYITQNRIVTMKSEKKQSIDVVASTLRDKIFNLVSDPRSWETTQLNNVSAFSLGALIPISKPLLDIYYPNDTVAYVKGSDPISGFNLKLEPCSGFNPTVGNADCPFRYEVRLVNRTLINSAWVDSLEFTLLFNSSNSEHIFNAQKAIYNFTFSRNFDARVGENICVQIGGTFDAVTLKCNPTFTKNVTCALVTVFEGTVANTCAAPNVTSLNCSPGEVLKGFTPAGIGVCGNAL